MGLFSAGKKVAKFTFISMPLSILGFNQLRMGNQQIKALWRSNFNPSCPECNSGILVKSEEGETVVDQPKGVDQSRILHPWTCSNESCRFAFLEEDDLKKVKDAARRYRNESVKASLTDMQYEEIERISKSHRMHSRAFFVACFIAAAGAFYMAATGSGILLALNWLSISFALWVFAMKKSYRSWQVKTGQLFVEGAFWFWFQTEKWIV